MSELAREIASDENCLADSNTAGKQSEKPENQFFVAMTRLGKPVSNLDRSKEQPAGTAELQLGKAGEGDTAPFLLGYPTLMGTGLLKVILGLEQFEPELESTADATELDDDELWYSEQQSKEEHSKEEHRRFWYQFDPGLDLDEFQMPIIKGTTEEQRTLATLCLEFKHLFGVLRLSHFIISS